MLTKSLIGRISKVISEKDLKNLINDLDGNLSDGERWEDLIEKKSDHVSYTAKCCRPKVCCSSDDLRGRLVFSSQSPNFIVPDFLS